MNQQQRIRKQNKKLRDVVEGYMQEIEKLKKVNQQHQTEIETLLKFNQRLLTIIQTELNTYNSRKSERSFSLQPISEITQKDSQAVEPLGSIKASFVGNALKFTDFQIKQEDQRDKKSGHQTDRVMLGQHLEDALSYQISRSDYQKQYSEYQKKDRMKQVLALISAYKQQYGQSAKQCQDMKIRIIQNTKQDNKQIQTFSNQSTQFYGQKINQLNKLKQKIKQQNSQKQLQNIIEQKKYSKSTQNKLLKIMKSIN